MSVHTVSPDNYQQQLQDKTGHFEQSLREANINFPYPMQTFESEHSHYRMRAEFKIWHNGDNSHYTMTDPENKQLIYINEFPVASQAINHLMPKLMNSIHQLPTLRKKLFQIDFLSNLNGEMLVTMIYHRPLDDDWLTVATQLEKTLEIHIIGRSRKQKTVVSQDYIQETLQVNGKDFHYRQIDGGFTQPNARICEQMLSWAVTHSQDFGDDLLELYCGNGNFTLPLAQNFNKVLATEIAKRSVEAAHHNLQYNHINNVTLVRMSSEEFVQAWDQVRNFRRLANIELQDFTFSTVLVDPPRAGLDDKTTILVQRFNHIIYISCNPKTLINNLQVLCETHTITAIAIFDQFPYTSHVESGVILKRK